MAFLALRRSSQALSENQRRSLIGPFTAVLVAAVALAGCGGDDEGGKATGTTSEQQAATQTEPTDTGTATTETSETTETSQTATSPEDQPGGAGDEEPARSQALFTGRGGRIRPTVVRVPSFIAIRVVLRSGDGRAYALRFKGRTLQVNGSARSATADFAGLRPGKVLAGTGVNGSNAVRVEATAEPGP
jgi:hypothetical protein